MPSRKTWAAIVPATFGAAKEVPLQLAKSLNVSGKPVVVTIPSQITKVEWTFSPGAQASTHQPKLENHAGAEPFSVSAATEMTRLNAAGQKGRDELLFPAAATTTRSGRSLKSQASTRARP